MTTKTPRAHAALRKLHADGWDIEFLMGLSWEPAAKPAWDENTKYRLKLEDWQQRLVDAARAGKRVLCDGRPATVLKGRSDDETQANFADYIWQGESYYSIEDAAPAIPEGFTPWAGGECPVPTGTPVDVIYRDGSQKAGLPANRNTSGGSYEAGPEFWHNDGRYDDIIGYRIVKPAMQPTMKLRWLDDTLQQYFEAADGTGEWREVPTAEGGE